VTANDEQSLIRLQSAEASDAHAASGLAFELFDVEQAKMTASGAARKKAVLRMIPLYTNRARPWQ
jgi:hypothetical protein